MCLQCLREIIADTVKSMNLCVVSPFEHFSSSVFVLSSQLSSADDICGIRAPPTGHLRHCSHCRAFLLGYAQIIESICLAKQPIC